MVRNPSREREQEGSGSVLCSIYFGKYHNLRRQSLFHSVSALLWFFDLVLYFIMVYGFTLFLLSASFKVCKAFNPYNSYKVYSVGALKTLETLF